MAAAAAEGAKRPAAAWGRTVWERVASCAMLWPSVFVPEAVAQRRSVASPLARPAGSSLARKEKYSIEVEESTRPAWSMIVRHGGSSRCGVATRAEVARAWGWGASEPYLARSGGARLQREGGGATNCRYRDAPPSVAPLLACLHASPLPSRAITFRSKEPAAQHSSKSTEPERVSHHPHPHRAAARASPRRPRPPSPVGRRRWS
eukprot:COSAG02_NODE_4396_length_5408_cov_13.262938_4_plen_205_part_00